MYRLIAFVGFLLLFSACKNEPKQTTEIKRINPVKITENITGGFLERYTNFKTDFIKPRTVDVWLPNNYSTNKKYAVLYMHDGQMLFDSTTTWNKQEWKVDEWASKLQNEALTQNFIVVAIHNIAEIRWQDLFPEKAFSNLNKEEKTLISTQKNEIKQTSNLSGDNYLKFLVKELKPFIDSQYATLPSKEHTFVAGSSMGGLMSMYAICEYPEVFGGAACMSTHWPGAAPIDNNPLPKAIFTYVKNNVPNAKKHKLYFDYGTETLDAHYPQYASTVDSIFLNNGYTASNYKNLKFEGTDHSENSWNKRLNEPLTFLLKK